MPAAVEGQIHFPGTPRGRYAEFDHNPSPAELAEGMGIAFQTNPSEQYQAIMEVLGWLYESSRYGLSSRFLAYLESMSVQLHLQEIQVHAADAAAQAFGEVKENTEATLPLWVVWYALQHNTKEARSRLAKNAELVQELLLEIEYLLEVQIQDAKRKLREFELQKKVRQENLSQVKANQSQGYSSLKEKGQQTQSAFATVIYEKEVGIAALEKEIAELQSFRQLILQGTPALHYLN